jgi:hypothetical protein
MQVRVSISFVHCSLGFGFWVLGWKRHYRLAFWKGGSRGETFLPLREIIFAADDKPFAPR